MATQNYHTFVWWWWWWWSQVCAKLLFVKTRDKTKHVYAIVSDKKQSKLHTRRGGGGGGDEVRDRETMFSQLAQRSPRVVVSGKLQYFSHIKYF